MKAYRQITILALWVLLPGCASRRPNLIARSGGQPLPANAAKIAFMVQPHPRPEDRALERDVATELMRRGFQIVPQAEADFALQCVVEDNWLPPLPRPTHVYQEYTIYHQNSMGGTMAITPPRSGPMTTGEPRGFRDERYEAQVKTEGIRLRFHRMENLRSGKFDAAWEGYIEAGLKLRPEQQPRLLRTLFDYLGRDFVGHVKIGE